MTGHLLEKCSVVLATVVAVLFAFRRGLLGFGRDTIERTDRRVSDGFLSEALSDLVAVLGLQEPISIPACGEMTDVKRKELAQLVLDQLRLPIRLKLADSEKFESMGLGRTTQGTEAIRETITAQVFIPANLPLWGTKELNDFQIEVRLSRSCTTEPCTFVCVLAHELSHVLLHSLRHSQRENEWYTDLTPLVLGFGDIMAKGRTRTQTVNKTKLRTQFGYLSDHEFSFARRRISKLLKGPLEEKKRFRAVVLRYGGTLTEFTKRLSELCSYRRAIEAGANSGFRSDDAIVIVDFYNSCGFDRFAAIAVKHQKQLSVFESFCSRATRFTPSLVQQINQTASQVGELNRSLISEQQQLNRYVKLFRKYA